MWAFQTASFENRVSLLFPKFQKTDLCDDIQNFMFYLQFNGFRATINQLETQNCEQLIC